MQKDSIVLTIALLIILVVSIQQNIIAPPRNNEVIKIKRK
jgi:hypothetical protein